MKPTVLQLLQRSLTLNSGGNAMAIGRCVEAGVLLDDDGFASVSVIKIVSENEVEEMRFTPRQFVDLQVAVDEASQEMLELEWGRTDVDVDIAPPDEYNVSSCMM